MAYSGNGTGTQADPYQVTTIDQLLECFNIYNNMSESENGIYVYCKLMNDLDFNDNPKYWDCPSNLFYANNRTRLLGGEHIIYIDGNGYGIYNLYCYNKQDIFNFYCDSQGVSNQIVIQNLIFEAIAIHTSDNCSLFVAYYNQSLYYDSRIRLINCDLRIKYYSYWYQNEKYLLGNATQFTNCILNIDIVLNTQGYTQYSWANLLSINVGNGSDISSNNKYRNMYNEWKIRVIMVSEPPSTNYNQLILFKGTAHLFSSFFIELLAMKGNGWQICTSNPDYNQLMSIMNCYFVIKHITTLSSYKATPRIGGFKNGVNFYDNTLADNIADNSTGGGSLLALTTEQCKDAEYLESQGFIIAK
jgi:hypothetical protein